MKSTSKYTAKHRKNIFDYVINQRLVFSIEAKHVHINGGEWTSRKRNSDLYVFCLLLDTDAKRLDSWKFYVVQTSFLDEYFPKNKTISINTLKKMGIEACTYSGLRSCVDAVIGNREK